LIEGDGIFPATEAYKQLSSFIKKKVQ